MTGSSRKAEPTGAPGEPWRDEFLATLRLSWPLALSQLATVAMSTTDVVMMGWLGPLPLAAGTIATSVIFPCLFFSIGLLSTVAAFSAQELGARRYKGVRRTVRQGMWISILLWLPFTLLIWNGSPIMLLMGQDPEVAALADGYLKAAVWQVLPALLFVVFRNFISAHGRPRAALVITVLAIGLNALADYALMFGKFGFPRLELVGAGAATSIVQTVMAVVLLGFVLCDRRFRRYHLLVRFWKSDWPRFMEMLKVGLPTGFMTLAEISLFAGAAFLIGLFGAEQLAGHAVVLQATAVSFMIPLGISQAATVRVGLAKGRGDPAAVTRAGVSVQVLGLLAMLPSMYIFWFEGEWLSGLFLDLDDPGTAQAVGFAVSYLAVAAVFQLADGAQVIAAGALRGLNDTRVPMVIAIISYLPIGFGTAWYLGFKAGWEGTGIWAGLAFGLSTAAVFLVWRFFRRGFRGEI